MANNLSSLLGKLAQQNREQQKAAADEGSTDTGYQDMIDQANAESAAVEFISSLPERAKPGRDY